MVTRTNHVVDLFLHTIGLLSFKANLISLLIELPVSFKHRVLAVRRLAVKRVVRIEGRRSITHVDAMKRSPHACLLLRRRNISVATGADGRVYILRLRLCLDGSRTSLVQDACDRGTHARQPKQDRGGPL
jgi:hypothetical protein